MRFRVFLAMGALAWGQDPIAALPSLPFGPKDGYLPALLQALHIPIESQMAVFSKTSIQGMRIEPSNPRLLYFNDSTIVGTVRGGFIEIATLDPRRGMQYYALHQRPNERPVLRDDCLNCHKSGDTLIRSVIPSPDGIPLGDSNKPWGGWFVTGAQLPACHSGNTAAPTATSDIVALTVFAHQMRMMNLLAHAGDLNALVNHLLFLDETPEPIRGSSGFAEVFAAQGPYDHRGRSLRQLDLDHRLMRYPCSYMIYSPAFDAIPDPQKAAIYRRMWAILSGAEPSRISAADRLAIVEILRDTKADLPAYFVSW